MSSRMYLTNKSQRENNWKCDKNTIFKGIQFECSRFAIIAKGNIIEGMEAKE